MGIIILSIETFLGNTNTTILIAVFGGLFSFVWSVYQYVDSRKREQNLKEFDQYHKLIKTLVQPEDKGGTMFVDRQTAIIYELRHFKRYFPFSLRTLESLLLKWEKVENQFPRLLEETKLTIEYLNKKIK